MQLVVRTLSVLRYLSESASTPSLADIAEALAIPLPSVHRLMGILVDEEFVVRSPGKRYALGPAAWGLSRGPRRVADAAVPHMRELSRQTGETTFLTEMVGRRAVCTSLVDGTRPLRLFVRAGQEMPIHAAASARAILAFLPEREARAFVSSHELVRYTDDTPGTVDAVMDHLKVVAQRGYDVCDEELDLNVVALSVPIHANDGRVSASLTIAAPRERLEPSTRPGWTMSLLDSARLLSTECGYLPLPLPSEISTRRSAARAT